MGHGCTMQINTHIHPVSYAVESAWYSHADIERQWNWLVLYNITNRCIAKPERDLFPLKFHHVHSLCQVEYTLLEEKHCLFPSIARLIYTPRLTPEPLGWTHFRTDARLPDWVAQEIWLSRRVYLFDPSLVHSQWPALLLRNYVDPYRTRLDCSANVSQLPGSICTSVFLRVTWSRYRLRFRRRQQRQHRQRRGHRRRRRRQREEEPQKAWHLPQSRHQHPESVAVPAPNGEWRQGRAASEARPTLSCLVRSAQ